MVFHLLLPYQVQNNHNFDWESVEIIVLKPSYNKKLGSDMIHIKRQLHRTIEQCRVVIWSVSFCIGKNTPFLIFLFSILVLSLLSYFLKTLSTATSNFIIVNVVIERKWKNAIYVIVSKKFSTRVSLFFVCSWVHLLGIYTNF